MRQPGGFLGSYVGLRRQTRANGEPFLAGVVTEDLLLRVGALVELRRASDDLYQLLIVQPVEPWTKTELARATNDSVPRCGCRTEPDPQFPYPGGEPSDARKESTPNAEETNDT